MTSPTTPTLTIGRLNELDGAAEPTPFTLGISSRIVSFPDPLGLDVEASESLARDLAEATYPSEVLRRWLTPEDYQVLIDAHLTGRQAMVLLREARRHYEDFLGAPGKDTDSSTD